MLVSLRYTCQESGTQTCVLPIWHHANGDGFTMKAAVFDMDGLLIDSEPLWREAERFTFQSVGINLTDEMCHETLGLRSDEVVEYWYNKFPWTGSGLDAVQMELMTTVQRLISTRGQPLTGVYTILSMLSDRGLKLGLASSSPPRLIETVVCQLEIRKYFYVMCSAVNEERGKPDPAVYLTTARKLGVEPSDCIAFEDSVPGVRSAKAAGMSVVAVPTAGQLWEHEFDSADLKLNSLADFSLEMLGQFK